MRKSQIAEQLILKWIEASYDKNISLSLDLEELIAFVQSSHGGVTRQHVDKALKCLCHNGKLIAQVDGDSFKYLVNDKKIRSDQGGITTNSVIINSKGGDYDRSSVDDSDKLVTAAELMRRRLKKEASTRLKKTNGSAPKQPSSTDDIDEEIRRLEAELAVDSDSDNDSIDNNLEHTSDAATGIVCLSAVEEDRIEALPVSLLPTNKKRILKAIDGDADSRATTNKKKSKESTLQEFLDGYVARSAERIPFYCRVCAKQFGSEQEFLEHRQSDVHIAAVELDQKASFCKLCRKQFTSPQQMKDHLSSRPHKECLERMKSRKFSKNHR